MENEELIKKLCEGIRQLRRLRKVKISSIAFKLGYDSEQAYLKLERGEKKEIGITQLIIICELLDCSLINLFIFSGIIDSFFNNNITTWGEFYKSLENISPEKKNEILQLLDFYNENK
jgi:transcriptional regulator with XRE-family HTH domain